MRKFVGFLTVCCLFLFPSLSAASPIVITFEGFAPAGTVVNVNPGAPYSESGFTFTPTNAASAVFDSAAASDFPGDPTDWFGFAENNIITMTGPAPFSLDSLLMGPSTISGGIVDISVVGFLFGGGSINQTFSGLNTATLAVLNWTNLSSVQFRTTDDSALDDLRINSVPEPASLLLIGTGVAGLVARARRRRNRP